MKKQFILMVVALFNADFFKRHQEFLQLFGFTYMQKKIFVAIGCQHYAAFVDSDFLVDIQICRVGEFKLQVYHEL